MQDASSQNQKLQETLEEKERQIRGKSQNQEDKEKIQELVIINKVLLIVLDG